MAGGCIVADPGNRIVFWGAGAETLFGYTREEAHGMPLVSLFDEWPPASDRIIAHSRDGTPIVAGVSVEMWSHADEPLAMIVIRDLARDDFAAEVERSAHIGTFERSLTGGRDRWSAQIFSILGLPEQPIAPPLNEVAAKYVVDEDRERFRLAVAQMIEHQVPLRIEFRVRRPDGEVRIVKGSADTVRDAAGRVTRYVGNLLDVTPIREAAFQREDLQRQLEETRRIATLGRVAATMAHEFNNVMMGINTFAELLRRGADGEAAERATHGISSAIKRGRTITDEILRYTRASKPVLTTIDVAAWLADFTAEAQAIASNIVVRSEPELHIRGDVSQLNQILVNLLLNARDASSPDALITLEATRIKGGSIDLAVSDHGTGIPPGNREHVFDPLFTTKRHGTGLGLAIVQQVTSAHGGSVRVESEIGKGTTFHVILPGATTQTPALGQGRAKVLLIENDAGVAAGLAAILESEGMLVRTLATVATVAGEIERDRPDVLLLDLHLRDETYDAVAERWPDLPVILMSSLMASESDARSLQHPHAAFLQKPFEVEHLFNAIARVTRK